MQLSEISAAKSESGRESKHQGVVGVNTALEIRVVHD